MTMKSVYIQTEKDSENSNPHITCQKMYIVPNKYKIDHFTQLQGKIHKPEYSVPNNSKICTSCQINKSKNTSYQTNSKFKVQ